MSFFSINGWNVPIVNGGLSETSTQFGNLGPSFTNRNIISRRMIPRSWSGEMLFQSPEIADAVEGLVSGRGHHFPFDNDAWSDSGYTASIGTFANISIEQSRSCFGFGSAVISGDINIGLSLPVDRWAAIVWVYNSTDSSPAASPPVIVYDQYIETSDGTQYINGVNTSYTSFISVSSQGSIVISSATFPDADMRMDDLVVLPFMVDSSLASDTYKYQTANNCVMQCPFDYKTDFMDRVGGLSGVPTGVAEAGNPKRESGSGSLYIDSSADYVEFTTSPGDLIRLNTDKTITVSLWVNPTAILASTQNVAEHFSNTPDIGWRISIIPSGSVRVEYKTGVVARIVDSTPIVAGEFTHVCFTYKKVASTGRIELYINGASQGTNGATIVTPGTPVVPLYIGDPLGAGSMPGYVDDFRVYNSELTGQDIIEYLNESYFGYDFLAPSGRPFSSLPRVNISGDAIGSKKAIETLGNVSDETYVTHASSPNDRSVSFMLEEVSPGREEGIPKPDSHFLLDPKFLSDVGPPALIDPCSGYDFVGGGSSDPALRYDAADGFGFSYEFSSGGGSPYPRFALPEASPPVPNSPNFCVDMAGLSQITIAGWFYLDSFPTSRNYVFSCVDSGGLTRFGFGINLNPYPIFAVARSTPADLSALGGSSPVNVILNQWYFVAISFNLQPLGSGSMKMFGNVEASGASDDLLYLADSTGLGWGSDHFTYEEGRTKIGVYGNGTQEPLDGKVKNVMFWRREVPYWELSVVFNKGRKRRIFR